MIVILHGIKCSYRFPGTFFHRVLKTRRYCIFIPVFFKDDEKVKSLYDYYGEFHVEG